MKAKNISLKQMLLFGILILCAVFSICMTGVGSQNNYNAFAAEIIQSDYDNYIGKSLSSDAIPVWLRNDSDKQAGVEAKFKAAYTDMVQNNDFDMGRVYPEGNNYGIRQWNGYLIQEFREGDHRLTVYSRVHGVIVLGVFAENIDAACVVNEIFLAWSNNSGHYGYPVGNQFVHSGSIYQNFSTGYVKLTDRSVQFTSGKNLTATGEDAPLPVPEVEIGEIDGFVPDWGIEIVSGDAIKQSLLDAYDLITNTDEIKVGGYDLGSADNYASDWDGVAVTQRFIGGDNKGNPYSWGVQGRLMINDANGRAYALVDNLLTTWSTKGGFFVVGYPMSNRFVHEQKTIQVFSGMTLIVDELGYPNEYLINPGTYSDEFAKDSATAKYAPIIRAGFFDAYKAHNNAAVQNLGYAKDYIARFANTDVYYQEFAGGTSAYEGKSYIMQKGLTGRAHTVYGNSLKTFLTAGGAATVGGPLSNMFEAAGAQYQNFSKGYINITTNAFVAGKRMESNGTASDLTAEIKMHNLTGIADDSLTSSGYDGEVVYSLISERVAELAAQGYAVGSPTSRAYKNDTWGEQIFTNGDSSAARVFSADNATLIVVSGAAAVRAYVVKDAFLVKYRALRETNMFCGAPMGDEFVYGNRVFQNFKNGYMAKDSYGSVSYTKGLRINASGEFIDASTGKSVTGVPDNVGEFGDITRIPLKYRNIESEVKNAFQKEYARLVKEGFFPGETDEELVHGWAPGSFEWINQTFKRGDSTAMNVYGNNRVTKIFMTDISAGAFSVYSDMMTAWVAKGGLNDIGYPTSNQFTYNGKVYQNFTGGYIELPAGSPGSAVFHESTSITLSELQNNNGGDGLGLWWLLIVGGPVLCAGIAITLIILLKKRNIAKRGK